MSSNVHKCVFIQKKECSLYAVKSSQRPSTSCQIKGLFGMSINLIAKSLFISPCYTDIPKRKLVKSTLLLNCFTLITQIVNITFFLLEKDTPQIELFFLEDLHIDVLELKLPSYTIWIAVLHEAIFSRV